MCVCVSLSQSEWVSEWVKRSQYFLPTLEFLLLLFKTLDDVVMSWIPCCSEWGHIKTTWSGRVKMFYWMRCDYVTWSTACVALCSPLSFPLMLMFYHLSLFFCFVTSKHLLYAPPLRWPQARVQAHQPPPPPVSSSVSGSLELTSGTSSCVWSRTVAQLALSHSTRPCWNEEQHPQGSGAWFLLQHHLI